jgi:ATP-dependent DNA helicase RecG
MDALELLHIISDGENESVEFKRDLEMNREANRDIGREMAAFANTRGGYIIFGVEDDGAVVGVQSLTGFEERIMNIASDIIYPPIELRYESFHIKGKDIVLVEIPMGHSKPYSPRYIRRGTTKRQATREEERRLFQEGGLVSFDESRVIGTQIDDLDMDKIERYFQRTTGKRLEDFEIDRVRLLESKGIIISSSPCPLASLPPCLSATVAGILLFGKDPQRFLPQSAIKMVRFKGTEVGCDFIDRREAVGTLPEIIEEAVIFVQRHTNFGAKIEGIKRIDIPEYLPEVVREAVVNAVVHRDYSIRNAYISLFIFDDRLEIRSPGRLPNAASLELLPIGDHHPRNRLLFLLIEALGYGERVGTGIPRMLRMCREKGYAEPKFQEMREAFWVTLYGKRS